MSGFPNEGETPTRPRGFRRIWLVAAAAAVLAAYAPAHAQTPPAGDMLLEVKRFEVVGNNPLSESDTEAMLSRHLGRHTSLTTLEAAAESLENRMREQGFSFHRVIVPAQKPSGGVVRLEVLQFPLDSVEVTGQQHFSRENILRSLPGLKPGPSPDVREIARELALANEHPSKRLVLVMKESKKSDALDAEVRVRDVMPSMAFLSLIGNTQDRYDVINQNTGYTRLTAGYQNSNLLDRDHSITLTYTTSPEHPDKVHQYGAFYSIPFYGYNTSLQVYYLRSDVNTGSIGAGTTTFNVSGSGEFMGARLAYAMPKWGEVSQQISVALDDKHFESNSLVTLPGNGSVTLGSPSHSRPLSLRYLARSERTWGNVSGYGEIATNLPGGNANTDFDYNAARVGAAPDWHALRYGFDANYALGAWGLSARLRGQYSGSALIPGEQFGLGGATSIRGLREREFTGERGYTLTLEALGPALVDTLKPVVFFDYGEATLRSTAAVPGLTSRNETASSIGAGIRWKWKQQLDVSADLAYVLNGIAGNVTVPGTDAGHVKLNFTVFYRF